MNSPKHVVSLLLPLASILIVIGFVFFSKPTNLTGLTTIEQEDTRFIDADVILQTTPHEIIPEHSSIKITLDSKSASIPIKMFIEKTGKKFEYVDGKLDKVNYVGKGYSGNYSYNLTLKDFDLNTTIKNGTHTLTTEIIFNDIILYKNEKQIFVN